MKYEMSDLISRQQAIDALCNLEYNPGEWEIRGLTLCKNAIKMLPSVKNEICKECKQEVKPIGYRQCADSMMMMWMENIVTDGEYNRIMDKLNVSELAERWRRKAGKWI